MTLAHIDKLKFLITGILNTAIDFGIFNVLSLFVGLSAIFANTISTGVAMVFSFLLNKKWVFNSKSKNYLREMILFLVFTAASMWAINNGVVWLLLKNLPGEMAEFWRINLAKIIATSASMIWNYFTYKYFVFSNKNKDSGVASPN
jgi:putative flippase GtrA